MANVTIIKPTITNEETRKIRVTAYCRVSSSSEDQLNSYESQLKYYSVKFENSETEELIEIYADEGITGTRDDKRADFQRMMSDCRKGKIDIAVARLIQWNTENPLKSRLFLNKQTERSYFYTTLKIQKKQMGA